MEYNVVAVPEKFAEVRASLTAAGFKINKELEAISVFSGEIDDLTKIQNLDGVSSVEENHTCCAHKST